MLLREKLLICVHVGEDKFFAINRVYALEYIEQPATRIKFANGKGVSLLQIRLHRKRIELYPVTNNLDATL